MEEDSDSDDDGDDGGDNDDGGDDNEDEDEDGDDEECKCLCPGYWFKKKIILSLFSLFNAAP